MKNVDTHKKNLDEFCKNINDILKISCKEIKTVHDILYLMKKKPTIRI